MNSISVTKTKAGSTGVLTGSSYANIYDSRPDRRHCGRGFCLAKPGNRLGSFFEMAIRRIAGAGVLGGFCDGIFGPFLNFINEHDPLSLAHLPAQETSRRFGRKTGRQRKAARDRPASGTLLAMR